MHDTRGARLACSCVANSRGAGVEVEKSVGSALADTALPGNARDGLDLPATAGSRSRRWTAAGSPGTAFATTPTGSSTGGARRRLPDSGSRCWFPRGPLCGFMLLGHIFP